MNKVGNFQQPFEELPLAGGRAYVIERNDVPPHTVVLPHCHSDLEIVLLKNSPGTLRCGRAMFPVGTETICLAPPNAVHSYDLRAEPGRGSKIVLHVDARKFVCKAADGVEKKYGDEGWEIAEAATWQSDELAQALSALADASPRAKLAPDFYRSTSLVYEILRLAFSHEAAPSARKPEQLRLQGVIAAVSEMLDVRASLDAIARRCGMSKFHLCRFFKHNTGTTIHAYLNQLRINRAKYLLTGGENVTRVSLECGFSSVSHFIQLFRTTTGMTPKQWVLAENS